MTAEKAFKINLGHKLAGWAPPAFGGKEKEGKLHSKREKRLQNSKIFCRRFPTIRPPQLYPQGEKSGVGRGGVEMHFIYIPLVYSVQNLRLTL